VIANRTVFPANPDDLRNAECAIEPRVSPAVATASATRDLKAHGNGTVRAKAFQHLDGRNGIRGLLPRLWAQELRGHGGYRSQMGGEKRPEWFSVPRSGTESISSLARAVESQLELVQIL